MKSRFFAAAPLFTVLVFGFFLIGAPEAYSQQSRIALKSRVMKKIKKVKKPVAKAPKAKNSQQDGPWQGEMGVTRTTAEIQEEMNGLGDARPARKKREIKKIRPDRRDLPQNPDSPAIEKFPVDPSTKPVQEKTEGGNWLTPQTIGLNFNGGTLFDTLSFPPDTMGDVGPTQYIMAVNGWMRSFNKTTGAADGVLNVDMDVFFNSVRNGSSTTDPRIRYDRLTQRWFIVIINVENTNNRVLFAVSNSATITGATTWTYFFFNHNTVAPAGDANCFGDYPTLGIDANALYIGTNNFCPSNFGGTTAFVVRKSSITGAGPIVVTPFRGLIVSNVGLYTPQGVDNFDPAATEGYFIGVDNATFSLLKLRRVSNPGGTPTISADINLTVPTTVFPMSAGVPHLGNTGGTNGNLDGLDDRLYQAVIRNGRLLTAHNIQVGATGLASNAGGRNGSRWYEIENLATSPTLRQSGTWFDPTVTNPRSFWIPSIMSSGQGHIALGGSAAGAASAINAATIGRLATDPLGTLQATETVTNSTTAYNPAGDSGPPRRWGDYSYTSVDPEDDMTMWTIQQWNHATNSYAMRVIKLIAPPPAQPATAAPATINAGQASVNVTITGTQNAGSGFFDPGAGFAKRIAGAVSGGVTVNSVTYDSPTQVTLNLSTVGAAAGQKNVTITNPDGQALTGNNLITVNSVVPGVRAPFDFDGDGKTDIGIARNNGGVKEWWYQRSSNASVFAGAFGAAADRIAPGDFTGDNKADIAQWRPSTGEWFVLRSENLTFYGFPFGSNGDVPVPADFDGDNKTDPAVFRNGTWFILRSSDSGVTIAGFGLATDKPVPADFDGDNKADLAIFRPVGSGPNAEWWYQRSSNGTVFAGPFGAGADRPVPGDYTGDGKADIAQWRPSTGVWFVLRSEDLSFFGFPFGTTGDVPVPGNYDGDNKFDAAVFRPTGATWFIQRSGDNGTTITGFGLSTDQAIPSAFVP
jgi:hypothetical protein